MNDDPVLAALPDLFSKLNAQPTLIWTVGGVILASILVMALVRHGGFLLIGVAVLCVGAGILAFAGLTPNPEVWKQAPLPALKQWSHLAAASGLGLLVLAFLGIALRPGRSHRRKPHPAPDPH